MTLILEMLHSHEEWHWQIGQQFPQVPMQSYKISNPVCLLSRALKRLYVYAFGAYEKMQKQSAGSADLAQCQPSMSLKRALKGALESILE